jgi:hypothetical protein
MEATALTADKDAYYAAWLLPGHLAHRHGISMASWCTAQSMLSQTRCHATDRVTAATFELPHFSQTTSLQPCLQPAP